MKLARILVIITILMLSTFAVSAQEDACYNKGGIWDADKSTCTMKSGYEIDVNYPLSITQYPFAEELVDTYINDYKTQFAASYTPVDNAGSYTNLWSLSIDYQEFQHSENIISLLFTAFYYTGGAHPNSDFKSFIFDVKNGTELTLDNLFVAGSNPWPTIAAIVQQSLEAHLAEAYNTPLTDDDKNWIRSGTGEDPQNYQTFVLDGDSLVFHFPAYQVAPYVAGPQSVAIPLASLSGLVDMNVIGG